MGGNWLLCLRRLTLTESDIVNLYNAAADARIEEYWADLPEDNRALLLAFARNVASFALGERTEAELAEAKREALAAFIACKSACDAGSSGDALTSAKAYQLANERIMKLLAEPMPSYYAGAESDPRP